MKMSDTISMRKIAEYKPLKGDMIRFSDFADITDPKVFEMEAIMKTMVQIDIQTKHYFSEGLYAREITIPAGVTLCGEIHKYRNLNILSKGEMLVYGLGKVSAPFTVVSPPGTKRIAHTLTECVWTTIHATEETDVDKIKAHFVAQTEEEWLEFAGFNQLRLGL